MDESKEIKETVMTSAMRYGLYTGLVLIVASFSPFLLLGNVGDLLLSAYVSILLTGVVTVICLFRFTSIYKRSVGDRGVTYTQALAYSTRLLFFSCMIYMVGFYFYFRLYPTFFSDVMTQLVGVMSKAKDDANIQKLLPQYIELQKQSVNLSPLALAFEFGWTYIFCGFLVSLVSSCFAKGQSKIS